RGGSEPHRLCAGRPDDQLRATDGGTRRRKSRRLRQGLFGRRGGRFEGSEISLPLALSVAGHAVCVALLILLPTTLPPAPEPPPVTRGIEAPFEPALPKPEGPT